MKAKNTEQAKRKIRDDWAITRSRELGGHFLAMNDDGDGALRNRRAAPAFLVHRHLPNTDNP